MVRCGARVGVVSVMWCGVVWCMGVGMAWVAVSGLGWCAVWGAARVSRGVVWLGGEVHCSVV